jgi:CRP-like cAMP-binding protein
MLGLDEQTLETRSLARNEALFRQGDKVTAIYFVEAGRLRLERRTFDGRLLILGITPAVGSSSKPHSLPTFSIATPWRQSHHACASIRSKRS